MERCFIEYTRWREAGLPEDLAEELARIEDDEDEIYDRFCKDIAFGTSGLRGRMGAGTNRINSVMLRKATMGIARYLTDRYEAPGIVIGFDTRINSKEYAASVAEVFAEMGVDAYIFSEATPVPVVSFAVRHLGLNGGVMITASHNTREYNGYKVYDHFGNQIDDNKARLAEEYIKKEDPFGTGELGGENRACAGRGHLLDGSVRGAYLNAIKENILWWDEPQSCLKALSGLKVCYTPLNGSGLGYVTEVLDHLGVGTVQVVPTQKEPDGSFPTCPSPNPENEAAFTEAVRLCDEQDNQYDVILATDPDSDRMGVAVFDGEGYCKLSGNQVGELMLDYILRCHSKGICGRELREEMTAFKSFVSSPLTEKIGEEYGVKVKNVFTGFKNIALEMERLNREGRAGDFLFGFEESLGYLYGDYTRDKDGIMACQMLCLMAAEQKTAAKTLLDRLEEIYGQYGYIESITTAILFHQEKDRRRMELMVKSLFDGRLKSCPDLGKAIKKEFCYRKQNMYCADLEGGHRVIIRPSGTELKLKIYIFAGGKTRDEAIDSAARLCSLVRQVLEEKDKRDE